MADTGDNVARFIGAMNRISRLFVMMEGSACDASLSKPELLALAHIHREKRSTMSGLAGVLGINVSTATGLVDRLVGKKLLRRERNHGDRRLVYVVLTARGTKVAAAYQEQIQAGIRHMLGLLTPAEQAQLIAILEKISGDRTPGSDKIEVAEDDIDV
ncbi:MAG TPA: MarR family transcriptional regulator [Candidatus Methanoperedenaceae archaeon]|nr:MarR family transcriptional regulator [Candidatus Methanoperedenaceae archaeon]